MTRLALHQITLSSGGPAALIRTARAHGLGRVCLFTATPSTADGTPLFPIIAPAELSEMRALMASEEVSIINAEYFPLLPGRHVDDYRAPLDIAAALGARRIVTHIYETDPARRADQLHLLCLLAADRGLEVGLEFTGFASGCANLQQAAALHRELAQPGLGIAIDALHFTRTGGTLDQLAALDPAIICYAQLCDGPDLTITNEYEREAMNRMVPGEGVFPLAALLAALGDHVDIDIEVPCFDPPPGHDPDQWVAKAIRASRQLTDQGDL